MDIHGFDRPLPPERRRLQERGVNRSDGVASKAAEGSARSSATPAERLSLSLSPEQIQRYVDILKQMDPVDLHRVERFQKAIEDGSYGASVDELIDPLMDFLADDEPAPGEPE
jgi:flagellar biosynthesis anti-sigma factor FlgM